MFQRLYNEKRDSYINIQYSCYVFRPALAVFREIVKVKLTLEQATKAQRGSRGIAVLFL